MESALVAVGAALLAVLVTWWVGHALRALLFPELTLAGRVLHWRVAAVALVLAFASTWIVSVVPALQVARPHAAPALRLTATSPPRARARSR